MASVREIIIKPSCMNEIHGVAPAIATQLWEKINYLVTDPLPDGKLKKKIKVKKDLYRLRVGEYRVIYTFGDKWVSLLSIQRRDEHTYSEKIEKLKADSPTEHDVDDDDYQDELIAIEKPQFRLKTDSTTTPLSRTITTDWLEELKIPPGYFPLLVPCDTEEDLLGVDVPGDILERIINNLFPSTLDEVIEQPDLLVQDTADLIRYKNGDLISFLLKLDEDQMRLTDWALKGPTMVKGGAGTGKSTVALYRVKKILERKDATDSDRILFTTYTRALMTASQQLVEQLLPSGKPKNVRVATCDEIAREIVASTRKLQPLESGGASLEVLRSVRKSFTPPGQTGFDRKLRAQVLEKLSDRYLLEEFEWIIEGRGLNTQEEYLTAPRPGRGYSLREGMRETIWSLHKAFKEEVQKRGFERFSKLRVEALDLVRTGVWKDRYDYVLVDEAQDLTPAAICLMAEIAQSEEGIFFAADNKQSLYSRNYSWSVVHPRLQFKGRTAILKRNYRSTIEIDRAAFEILNDDTNGEDYLHSQSTNSGPLPVLLKGVPHEAEGGWAVKFIKQMARHLRMKYSSAAVLVPRNNIGQSIADAMSDAGIAAKFFSGRELDLKADVVKVMTIHSAKGLEFPIVVMAGFIPGTYPLLTEDTDSALYGELMANECKLLYVGMTRAMRGLMVIMNSSCNHEALTSLSSESWYIEEIM